MSKKLVSITFWVTLIGTIWQGIECTKEKQIEFTPEKHPFTKEWTGLRDALLLITKDGDFQNCSISWGCMVIRWFDGKYFIEREVGIPRGKLTEYFLEDE